MADFNSNFNDIQKQIAVADLTDSIENAKIELRST